ncbi:MAG: GrpB family protein [Anaerolineae bacterium]|nr:GrpB family protein [Anaerolineae bacterium]
MTDYNENEEFELSDYNPAWAQNFYIEADQIAEALGEQVVEVKHVGSTSIPGLRAKPIIDILVAVEEFASLESYEKQLESLGYFHHPHDAEDERLFFWKGTPRTHHLHIVEFMTWEHQRHIIFRDYLRAHPEMAELYEQVKRELSLTFKGNRPAYTKGKTAFIKTIMARAVEEIVDPSLRRLVNAAAKEEQAQRAMAHAQEQAAQATKSEQPDQPESPDQQDDPVPDDIT